MTDDVQWVPLAISISNEADARAKFLEIAEEIVAVMLEHPGFLDAYPLLREVEPLLVVIFGSPDFPRCEVTMGGHYFSVHADHPSLVDQRWIEYVPLDEFDGIRNAHIHAKYLRMIKAWIRKVAKLEPDKDQNGDQDIPASYRDNETMEGEPLTARYVKDRYGITGTRLSNHATDENRRKIGRAYVYKYRFIKRLSDC